MSSQPNDTNLMRMIAAAEAKFDAHRVAMLENDERCRRIDEAEAAFAFNRARSAERRDANAAKCARQRGYCASGS